ncbi:protein SCO1/2 [Palleronia aestuarii]|uniref:Protein SCO1/2 n=1 Tax=Palleronia aestuarii TaxID=568105 RepID=A0A2W7QDF5_9RHOB|nr:SCO family protein [Palleronia aestuarii]PZX19899.1 protein SCO1/2 [Palleronia aestuarii]
MMRGASPLRLVAIGLWVLVLLALVAIVWFRVIAPRFTEQVSDTLGQGKYELVTTEGAPFTADTLAEGPAAVFFGFTHCPDVCPTTLGDIATWKEALGAEGDDLNVYFVTVDPERDTADVLGDYVSWSPGVIGVTGSPEEIEAATRAFRIYAQKVPLDDGGYTMDHSALVLLFDEDGHFFEPIGYQEGDERALAKLRRLLAS